MINIGDFIYHYMGTDMVGTDTYAIIVVLPSKEKGKWWLGEVENINEYDYFYFKGIKITKPVHNYYSDVYPNIDQKLYY
jgi:hypothetical protein